VIGNKKDLPIWQVFFVFLLPLRQRQRADAGAGGGCGGGYVNISRAAWRAASFSNRCQATLRGDQWNPWAFRRAL